MRGSPHAARLFVSFLLLLCALSAPAKSRPKIESNASGLADSINKILEQPDIARGFWGIEIDSLTNGKVLYSSNEDKFFTPASNTKLFTTAATMALIGPDYRFRTTVETAGTARQVRPPEWRSGAGGTRRSEHLWPQRCLTTCAPSATFLRCKVLREPGGSGSTAGVKFVDGDVIGDDSYFAFERYGEGWAQDDMVWEWGAPVSALTINDNVVFVNILPADHAGDRAFVNITPYAEYYQVDNRIMTTPQGPVRAGFTSPASRARTS